MDDTQVLRDNLDMLGEKNLYVYCDDNPIMRVDGDGQFFWIGGLIGAAVNVVTGGIAASVTGQRYTIVDMVAAVSGFFAGGLTCFSPGIVSMIGGCISGSYAVYCSLKRGDSLLMIALNVGIAFGVNSYIGNLTGFSGLPEVPTVISSAWGFTYGLGANLIAAGVSAGTSVFDTSGNNILSNMVAISHVQVPVPKAAIGQKRSYNGKTKSYRTSFIYRTSSGKLACKKRKSYHSRNACTV